MSEDLGWMDEFERPDGELAADTPAAVLGQIMGDATQPATARVAAARLLADRGLDGGPRVDGLSVFDLSGMSDEHLDRELAGFFGPGDWRGPEPGEPISDEWACTIINAVAASEDAMPATRAALTRWVTPILPALDEERIEREVGRRLAQALKNERRAAAEPADNVVALDSRNPSEVRGAAALGYVGPPAPRWRD